MGSLPRSHGPSGPADDQIALVTGASSGIGEAIAFELASRGHAVALVARLSEAVHSELAGTGVTVTAVCPGPVRTEFMDAASPR